MCVDVDFLSDGLLAVARCHLLVLRVRQVKVQLEALLL